VGVQWSKPHAHGKIVKNVGRGISTFRVIRIFGINSDGIVQLKRCIPLRFGEEVERDAVVILTFDISYAPAHKEKTQGREYPSILQYRIFLVVLGQKFVAILVGISAMRLPVVKARINPGSGEHRKGGNVIGYHLLAET